MKQSTESMIRELAADLPPVKPLGRLRDTLFVALSVSLPLYLYWIVTRGVRQQFRQGEAPDGIFLMAGSVLLLMAAGGLIAGLAAAIPGRQDASRLGRRLCLGGLALGLPLLAYHGAFGGSSLVEGSRSSVQCMLGAAMLSLPVALIAARFIARGAARHLPGATALACMGAMAVSAGVIHLSCGHAEPLHLLLGHALAPLSGGTLVLVGLSLVSALRPSLRRPERA